MARNQEVGRRGEDAAAVWYRTAGYEVLDRNWRCSDGELDLVVCRSCDVIFVEVKARSTDRFGSGAEAVDHRKQRKVRTLATRWLAAAPKQYREVRFDVVDVDGAGTVTVYEGCF